MGSHLHHGPIGQSTVVHRESIMMLEYGDHVFCAGLAEEDCPGMRIEVLSLEHGNEVFVAEFRQRTISSNLVFIFVAAWLVHVSRIPFVSIRRHREGRPVNEYSKFRV